MRFGVSFASHPDCLELVPRIERAGYDSVWFYDSPALGSDPFVVLALVAQRSTAIDLGIGVAVPSLRMPHVLATAIGTLAVFAPGRLRLGLGTGFTAALSIGARPATWETMVEHVNVVRGWLRDETVRLTVNGIQRPARHLHAGRGHLNTGDPVPLLVGATGPRGLQIAGDIGDGLWTISVDRRPDPGQLATDIGVARTRAVARGATDFPAVLLTAVAVQQPGESADSARLRSFLGPWVTTYLHSVFPIFAGSAFDGRSAAAAASRLSGPSKASPVVRDAERRYLETVIRKLPPDAPWLTQHTGHSVFVREEEQPFITAEVIEALALVGSPDALMREIAALEVAGVTELVWQVVPGHEDEIELFATKVIQPFRAHASAGFATSGPNPPIHE